MVGKVPAEEAVVLFLKLRANGVKGAGHKGDPFDQHRRLQGERSRPARTASMGFFDTSRLYRSSCPPRSRCGQRQGEGALFGLQYHQGLHMVDPLYLDQLVDDEIAVARYVGCDNLEKVICPSGHVETLYYLGHLSNLFQERRRGPAAMLGEGDERER